MTDSDKSELEALKKRVPNAGAAASVDLDVHDNREFGTKVLHQYDPGQQTIINEFQFKTPEALKAALTYVKKLRGVK